MADGNPEGSIWFWRIFGGAIVGLVSLLAITLVNTINTSNLQSKNDTLITIAEIRSDIRSINSDLINQKEKLSKIESAGYENEIEGLRKKIDDINIIVSNRTERIASIEGTIQLLKDQVTKDTSLSSELYKKILDLENEIKMIKSQSQNIQVDADNVKKTLFRE